MRQELVQAGLGIVAVGRQLARGEPLRRLVEVAVRQGCNGPVRVATKVLAVRVVAFRRWPKGRLKQLRPMSPVELPHSLCDAG
eukprot:4101321-Prorocentrum_lima.AAC.1